MKFVVDESVGCAVVEKLWELKYEVVSVGRNEACPGIRAKVYTKRHRGFACYSPKERG